MLSRRKGSAGGMYDWEHHRSNGYRWWLARLRQNFHLFDVIRLDHMRGFESYYSIPADTQNPLDGHWEKGPDMDFFHQVEREFPASGFPDGGRVPDDTADRISGNEDSAVCLRLG